jgi:hypothetical protein
VRRDSIELSMVLSFETIFPPTSGESFGFIDDP